MASSMCLCDLLSRLLHTAVAHAQALEPQCLELYKRPLANVSVLLCNNAAGDCLLALFPQPYPFKEQCLSVHFLHQ